MKEKPSVALNAKTYDEIAEKWHEDHRVFDWWNKSTEEFIGRLPPGGTVLDVGCAGGVKMKFLRKAGLDVSGVDISEKFLDIVRREQPGVPVYQADMNDLTGIPGTYDGIYASASLLHIEKADVPGVLRQFATKLKPGGFLYISVKGMRDDSVAEAYITEDDVGTGPYQRFFSFFTLPELRDLLRAAGMPVVYEYSEHVGRSNWIQIIGQKS